MSSQKATITVQSAGNGSTVLSACGAVLVPGNYVLSADLASSSDCLTFESVAGVQLDCRGHALSSARIGNASGITVTNCSMTSLVLETVGNVSVTTSTMTGGGESSTGARAILPNPTR
ncbi:MAG: hypothetical protein ACRD1V_05895 [Vicinamibacterales bacterium]